VEMAVDVQGPEWVPELDGLHFGMFFHMAPAKAP
jgi:hypothetical protein